MDRQPEPLTSKDHIIPDTPAGYGDHRTSNQKVGVRIEGAIAICEYCGFALVVEGTRECCRAGRDVDVLQTDRNFWKDKARGAADETSGPLKMICNRHGAIIETGCPECEAKVLLRERAARNDV